MEFSNIILVELSLSLTAAGIGIGICPGPCQNGIRQNTSLSNDALAMTRRRTLM
jgi:hypothetical protein